MFESKVLYENSKFSIVRELDKCFLYPIDNHDILLKSGSFQDCLNCISKLEG